MRLHARATRYALAALATAALVHGPQLAAADANVDMNYTNAPREVIPQNVDIGKLAKVRFFVSSDQGKSWQLLAELLVPDNATEVPRYLFKPTRDGSYLLCTCSVYKEGPPQPDPAPGIVPSEVTRLTVDTIKPLIAAPNAALDHATPIEAVVVVTWSVSDANLGDAPVQIEASADGGATWPASITGAAQGSGRITVAITRASRAVQVRVSAHDLAGNTATADPVSVALPPPPDPQLELAKAVNELPAVQDIVATDKSLAAPAPADDDSQGAAKPAAPAGEAPAAAGAAQPATHAPAADGTDVAGPTAPDASNATHQDVVVPNTPAAAVASPADGGFVAGTGLEQSYEARTQVPGTPAAPVSSTEIDTHVQPADDSDRGRASIDTTAPPAVARAQPDAEGFLPNPDAEVLLAKARETAQAGNTDGALVMYRRLQDSGQATTAIPEELTLLAQLGDAKGVVATVDALPIEYLGDVERLDQARALVQLHQEDRALGVLARIHAGAHEAREGLWLMAASLRALKREHDARKVLTVLAKGDDDWAARARTDLGAKAPAAQ
jgi:hypothetical protein